MLKTVLLCTLVGIAAAFFRPAQPHQVAAPAVVEVPRGGAFTFEAKPKPFIDDDLDNFSIEADDAITAARKVNKQKPCVCLDILNDFHEQTI